MIWISDPLGFLGFGFLGAQGAHFPLREGHMGKKRRGPFFLILRQNFEGHFIFRGGKCPCESPSYAIVPTSQEDRKLKNAFAA
jgi:hypothetical protein